MPLWIEHVVTNILQKRLGAEYLRGFCKTRRRKIKSKQMEPTLVDVVLPQHFLEKSDIRYLLGCYKTFGKHTIINCTFSCDQSYEDIFQNLPEFRNIEEVLDCRCGVTGILHDKSKKIDSLVQWKSFTLNDVSFILTVNQKTLEILVESLFLNGSYVNTKYVRIIIYDSFNFTNSQLLLTTKDNYIIQFLSKSAQLCLTKAAEFECGRDGLIFPVEGDLKPNSILLLLYTLICSLLLILRRMCDLLFVWWPKWFAIIYLNTAVGRQLHQRMTHLKSITDEMRSKSSLSLCACNLVSAIMLDLFLGWIVFGFLTDYTSSESLLIKVMSATNGMVNELQKLIYWLMGVPAGLKLNIPVNSALGHFFLYHIYLWKSYINIVQPLFEFTLRALLSIGLLGATFIPCLVNDIVSLATVHIYCFYGYAARLYYYQLYCISLLWRLFRGKKWNAELQRVESHTYNIHVLYIGTLVFTVLLFLLPTVMVYYFVFVALRIAVLAVQGVVARAVNMFTVLPVFVLVHRLFHSSVTAGDIYFSVLKQDHMMVLSLEVIQVPFTVLIKQTLPLVIQHGQHLSWKQFLSCIVWGKIIYPL